MDSETFISKVGEYREVGSDVNNGHETFHATTSLA